MKNTGLLIITVYAFLSIFSLKEASAILCEPGFCSAKEYSSTGYAKPANGPSKTTVASRMKSTCIVQIKYLTADPGVNDVFYQTGVLIAPD